MSRITEDISSVSDDIIKIVLSEPEKDADFQKAVIRPLKIKGEDAFQLERFKENKAFHLNCKASELVAVFSHELDGKYKQILIETAGQTFHYHKKNNGGYSKKMSQNRLKKTENSHNREKTYILNEGENIPALVELGVFTPDFRVVKAKYDKFKQINRFVELIDNEFRKTDMKDITILDFGCGKSYLTFIVYYYFAVKKGMNTKIIGYDLKKDVVEHCNKTAEKYHYDNLKFVVSDVSKDTLYDEKIDMIITLHACDTATDYALDYAIKKGAEYIFSVPCCQHEINNQIKKGGDFDIMLKHGIVKERVSALLTDSIRAAVLEDMGYKTDLIEFIDFEHSPKNIMIRAKKCMGKGDKNIKQAKLLCEKYGFKQTLLELAEKY